jgi:hypothetical protein
MPVAVGGGASSTSRTLQSFPSTTGTYLANPSNESPLLQTGSSTAAGSSSTRSNGNNAKNTLGDGDGVPTASNVPTNKVATAFHSFNKPVQANSQQDPGALDHQSIAGDGKNAAGNASSPRTSTCRTQLGKCL